MNEDQFAGTARNVGGKVQEGFGRWTGDAKTQAEGVANQATGAAQDLYGQAREAVRDTAGPAADAVRDTIETRPYTALLIAFAVGCVIGRLSGRSSW